MTRWIAANCSLIHKPVSKGRCIRQSVTSKWLKFLRHGQWHCCNWYDISFGIVTQFLDVCIQKVCLFIAICIHPLKTWESKHFLHIDAVYT